jgi:hypothetical protein
MDTVIDTVIAVKKEIVEFHGILRTATILRNTTP